MTFLPIDSELHNHNISAQTRLRSPRDYAEAHPVSALAKTTILSARHAIRNILDGKEQKMMIIIGPCSIHDPHAALDYATRLKKLSLQLSDELYLIMRVYFEKPRTTIGWKGLINDPDLNGTFDVARGLAIARSLLIKINAIGLPVGTEALDPITPQYIGDLISWTAIGARTAESQTHREMSSGLSTPVGFKNSTDGSLDVAFNAIESAAQAHSFLGVDSDGYTAIIRSRGNRHSHVVLRGGGGTTNYDAKSVAHCRAQMEKKAMRPNIVIDCSHANSNKDPQRQAQVLHDIVAQKIAGQTAIVGAMLESNINGGNQQLGDDPTALKYGVSITDACIDWDSSAQLLHEIYEKLKAARQK